MKRAYTDTICSCQFSNKDKGARVIELWVRCLLCTHLNWINP